MSLKAVLIESLLGPVRKDLAVLHGVMYHGRSRGPLCPLIAPRCHLQRKPGKVAQRSSGILQTLAFSMMCFTCYRPICEPAAAQIRATRPSMQSMRHVPDMMLNANSLARSIYLCSGLHVWTILRLVLSEPTTGQPAKCLWLHLNV